MPRDKLLHICLGLVWLLAAASSYWVLVLVNAGAFLAYHTTGDNNTALGHNTALGITTGNSNTAIGSGALGNVPGSTSQITAVGVNAAASLIGAFNGSTVIGYNATVTGLGGIAIGANATAGALTARIGDNTLISIGGYQNWTNVSDARHKRDVLDLDLGLQFLSSLRPVKYRLITGNQREDWGFIAQEVEQALQGREVNIIEREDNEEQTYRMRSGDLIAVLVKAVQELSERVKQLENKP